MIINQLLLWIIGELQSIAPSIFQRKNIFIYFACLLTTTHGFNSLLKL